MKQLTREQFLDSKVGDWFDVVSNNRHLIIKGNSEKSFVELGALGIELIPEKPPITIDYLGRFMSVFEAYPLAQFIKEDTKETQERCLLAILGGLKVFIDSYGKEWNNCEIIDTRWTAENLGGENEY